MSGKLWMFSDQLDDEDLEFARHSFFRYADGIAYYRLTEKTDYPTGKRSGSHLQD